MELIIIEFLFGIAVGTISGLLIVKHTGARALSRRTISSRRLRTTRQTIALRPTKTRNTRRSLHRARPRTVSQPSQAPIDASTTTLAHQPIISSCPACGLQAPPNLLAEHFLGSPSHEQGLPPADATPAENSLQEEFTPIRTEEDSRNSLRHLLQMLVPPRAFGRRHSQKTVNPLLRLVQTIE